MRNKLADTCDCDMYKCASQLYYEICCSGWPAKVRDLMRCSDYVRIRSLLAKYMSSCNVCLKVYSKALFCKIITWLSSQRKHYVTI